MRIMKIKRFSLAMLLTITMLVTLIVPMATVNAATGMFPKMTSAASVDLYDIRNDSADARASAYALQGLINQTSAKIFVWERNYDSEQLDFSGKTHTHVTLLSGSDAGFRTMFKNNKSVVTKLIIYDPAKDYTYNLACMMGAQQGGIPVTDAQRTSLKTEFGWTGTETDIRTMWSNNIAAYDYALTNLMPNCNKKFVVSLNRIYSNSVVGNEQCLYDYAVASKAFIFWLNKDISAENTEIQKIVSTSGFATNASCMGYSPNGDNLLDAIGPYGFGYVVSDNFSNGSVWSSFPSKTYTQQRAGNAVTAQNNKVYVSIYWSDGDNIMFDQEWTAAMWHESARGTVPVGTTLAPVLQEIAPPLLDWYYANKTSNDELVAGPCGYQFIYMNNYKSTALASWLTNNNTWVKDAGFRIACPWRNTTATLQQYLNASPDIDGIVQDNSNIPTYNGKVYMGGGQWCQAEGDVYNYLSSITPSASAPRFASVWLINGPYGLNNLVAEGFAKLKREVDRLNTAYPGRFVFQLPSDLMATYKLYANSGGQPAGYAWAAPENNSYNFGVTSVDVAYGSYGSYNYLYNKSGAVTFNNAIFGDPIPGVAKMGYYKIQGIPTGYTWCAADNNSYNFGSTSVDVAYGANGHYNYLTNKSGTITFNTDTFGDPLPGGAKAGYYKIR